MLSLLKKTKSNQFCSRLLPLEKKSLLIALHSALALGQHHHDHLTPKIHSPVRRPISKPKFRLQLRAAILISHLHRPETGEKPSQILRHGVFEQHLPHAGVVGRPQAPRRNTPLLASPATWEGHCLILRIICSSSSVK